jgi:predicted nucleic acid-binding Zn ribbon protein
MSDDPVKECEVCGEPVRRLLFPVAVHFKGNGFYSTDYAKKNALGAPGTTAGNGGSADSASSSDDKGSADTAKPPACSVDTPAPAAATAKND